MALLLMPLKTRVRDCSLPQADGHCMYGAVQHQLQQAGVSDTPEVAELRALTAQCMRAHPNEFMPFIEAVRVARLALYMD